MRRNQATDQFIPAFAGLAGTPVRFPAQEAGRQPSQVLAALQDREFDPALVVTPVVGTLPSVPDFPNSAENEESGAKKLWLLGLVLGTLWLAVRAKA